MSALTVANAFIGCLVARNQLATACAQQRSQKVNQATPSFSHSPVKAPVPVRTHCTNAWWNRCKIDLNSFPHMKLEEPTGTSSYYMDENHSAGSEIQRPQYWWCRWLGSEPSTLQIDVYVRRYALLVVLARNDDDDAGWTASSQYCSEHQAVCKRSLYAGVPWGSVGCVLYSAVRTAACGIN